MDKSLKELTRVMPPLEELRSNVVDWKRVEERVGVRYPSSFKEFVAAYGCSVWFGTWYVFYDTGQSPDELDSFVKSLVDFTSMMTEHGMYRWGYSEKISLPLYPEPGGLLPFLVDYDNNCLYCWSTKKSDPDSWPVTCWVDRQITQLRGITIAGMFLEWLQRSARMRKIWGDVRDLEPHRLKLYPG